VNLFAVESAAQTIALDPRRPQSGLKSFVLVEGGVGQLIFKFSDFLLKSIQVLGQQAMDMVHFSEVECRIRSDYTITEKMNPVDPTTSRLSTWPTC